MLFLIFVAMYLLIGGLIIEGYEWLVRKAFDSGVITENDYDEISIHESGYDRLGIYKLLVWAMWPYIIVITLIKLWKTKDDIGTE